MIVRAATVEEWSQLPALVVGSGGAPVVVEDGGRRLGSGNIDPRGGPVDPGTPRLWVALNASWVDQSERLRALDALVTELLSRARALGPGRLLLAWDTLDVPGQTVLARAGFRPGSRWPYFPMGEAGGGAASAAPASEEAIEYVTGYRDPSGSVVDLVAEL